MTLRYAVNTSILFTELPPLVRPAAARSAGFTAVECWWPFGDAGAPADAAVEAFIRSLDDAGVQLTGLNFADDLSCGGRGLVSVPAARDRFRDSVDVAVGIGERTGCRLFNALYGDRLDGERPAAQDELAIANLGFAAKAVSAIGGTVLVEALNSFDAPAYPIVSTEAALAVIDRAEREEGATNLALLFDLYHMARMGEDPLATIAAHAAGFGHVQIADVPGRHEPGTGTLDIDGALDALVAAGYDHATPGGVIGLEYKPSTDHSADSFGWLRGRHRADD